MLLSTKSFAATGVTTFNVTTTVVVACTMSATDLVFGNYISAELDGVSTITVTCTNGAPYTVALNVGTGTGATFTQRKMMSGGNTLNYNIYTTSARTTIWGDGTSSTSIVPDIGSGVAQPITVYGRIPSGQTSLSGTYTDTITATITY